MAIRYLEGETGETASPLVAAVYAQMRRDFGLVAEPLRVQAPSPPILAAAWGVLREAVLGGVVPRRVGPAEVAAFRAAWPGDRALVAVTAWASFTAARRISSWLDPAG